MERLHAAHAIVLDPRTRETWMALPFSSVPTPFAIDGGGRSWFANCAWDAFGIPVLVGVDAVIETTCPDCDAPIVYRVEQRTHSSTRTAWCTSRCRAAEWWDNIGFT